MTSLEGEGRQDIQALIAIRHTLRPLIAKRILDDTDKITSLAVSNSRDSFKYELDQVLLNLTQEQHLDAGDLASFLNDFHPLLQLLEDLVDEKVLTSSVNPGAKLASNGLASFIYPKLAALTRTASDDAEVSKLLHLPEVEQECKEAEQILTDFNIKNLSRSNTAALDDVGSFNIGRRNSKSLSTKSQPRSHQDETMRQAQECLSSILHALRNNIRDTECPDYHIAKLQIRDPANVGNELPFKLFLTCSIVKDKWQETHCTAVRDLPSNLKVKNVNKICKDIQRSLREYEVLDVLVHSGQIHRFSKSTKRTKTSPTWPIVSLKSIIATGEEGFRPVDKVILAMNLSKAFLRMYNSEMHSKEWNAGNIFFLFNPAERTIYELYNPYFTYSLHKVQEYVDDEPDRPRKFPVLISFAQVLLEIALGKSLGPFSAPRDIALLELIEESEAADSVVKGYLDAIATCLEANKRAVKRQKDDSSDSGSDSEFDSESDDDDDGEPRDEEAQCRAVIEQAVAYLEDARSNLRSRKDRNFPRELRLSSDVQSHMTPRVADTAAPSKSNGSGITVTIDPTTQNPMALMLQDKYSLGSQTQLFDVRKMIFNAGDERIFRANNFLGRAEEFYKDHIEKISNDKKIRVAILDTGIDEHHPFFKGWKRRRAAKDTPFKGCKSFTGDSSPADTFGHGTNVASLILRMAPEANLYIAKISAGQEEEGPEPVVQAIQWATSPEVNADIISMSFAYLEDQPTIEQAIQSAETKGVIFFAAASNYGGNTARLFPARLQHKVLCIHASDGDGNKSGMDPTPKPFSENLSTLGVALPSIWEPGSFVSGTSYSTPIIVGISANVLRFIQHATNEGSLTQQQRTKAFSIMGLRSILIAMSEVRDKYNYVTPWRRLWHGGATIGDVVSKIKEALRE